MVKYFLFRRKIKPACGGKMMCFIKMEGGMPKRYQVKEETGARGFYVLFTAVLQKCDSVIYRKKIK